jgi:hypothetical protein
MIATVRVAPRPVEQEARTLMSGARTSRFDRMRGTLLRAAEIRDSEQQQIFDPLDGIHPRLTPLDALGSMRKRLTELPDRTEVSVLAELVDETVAKVDAQEAAVAAVGRAVEATPASACTAGSRTSRRGPPSTRPSRYRLWRSSSRRSRRASTGSPGGWTRRWRRSPS